MHVVGYIVTQTWVLILNESYSSVLLLLHIIVHLAYISILYRQVNGRRVDGRQVDSRQADSRQGTGRQ